MTPTLVLKEKVAAHWLFSDIQMSWSNQALRALADLVRQQPDPIVDLLAVFGDPPQPALLIDDGVHPSLAGQMTIARALVERLSS